MPCRRRTPLRAESPRSTAFAFDLIKLHAASTSAAAARVPSFDYYQYACRSPEQLSRILPEQPRRFARVHCGLTRIEGCSILYSARIATEPYVLLDTDHRMSLSIATCLDFPLAISSIYKTTLSPLPFSRATPSCSGSSVVYI